jgi:hypothetical protein
MAAVMLADLRGLARLYRDGVDGVRDQLADIITGTSSASVGAITPSACWWRPSRGGGSAWPAMREPPRSLRADHLRRLDRGS